MATTSRVTPWGWEQGDDSAASSRVTPGGWEQVVAVGGGPTSYTLTADAGAYTLGGQDASLLKSRIVTADAGAYALAGQDATLTYTPVSGSTYTLTCDAGAYVLAGQDAALIRGRVVAADAGNYSLDGQNATFAYSGEPVVARRHAGGYRLRKGYIIKGQRYWLDEVELAVKVAEMIADISRGDIKEVTAGKPKTISKRTWDAIKPLERIEALADMLKPHDDDEEEALLMLM